MIHDRTCQEERYLRNEKLELNGALFLVLSNGKYDITFIEKNP